MTTLESSATFAPNSYFAVRVDGHWRFWRGRISILRLLESMASTPAFVRNARNDTLACNPLLRALYAPVITGGAETAPIQAVA